jgi:RNase H
MALESKKKISCKKHQCVFQCKQLYYDLQRLGHDITHSWVPAHVGIAGNEIADEMAKNACESASISDQPPFPNDFKITAKQQMKQKWQLKCKNSDTRRMAHSIFPNIATKPWFNEIQEERGVISTFSRIITGPLRGKITPEQVSNS